MPKIVNNTVINLGLGEAILALYQEPAEEPGANTFLAIQDVCRGGYLMVTLGSAGNLAEALTLANWARHKLRDGGLPIEVTVADETFQVTLGPAALLRLAPVVDNLEVSGSVWVEMILAREGENV